MRIIPRLYGLEAPIWATIRLGPFLALLVLFAAAVFGGGAAKAAESGIGDLQDCARLQSDKDRLACFDAATRAEATVTDAEATTTQATTAETQATTAEAQATTAEAQAAAEVGQEQLETVAEKKARNEDIEISAMVTEVSRNAYNLYSFHLDNGQIWQQTERARVNPPDPEFAVTITKGSVGGYRLRMADSNKLLRVKRLH